MPQKRKDGFRFLAIMLLCVVACVGLSGRMGTAEEASVSAARHTAQQAAATQWPRGTSPLGGADRAFSPTPSSTPWPADVLAYLNSAGIQTPNGMAEASILDPSAYRSLEQGDQGEDVLALKTRLAELGYFSTATVFSKNYSEATATAVFQFQKDHGLEPTGIADPLTQAILFSDALCQSAGQLSLTRQPGAGNSPTLRPSQEQRGETEATEKVVAYIGNSNTKKFHRLSCSSIKQMKDSNKVSLFSREEAIKKGYVPCKRCNP